MLVREGPMILVTTLHLYILERMLNTHAWAFVRQPSPTPSIVYNGNDGGLVKSTDRGATWVARIQEDYRQDFFTILVRDTSFYSFYKSNHLGALQDTHLDTTDTAVGNEWKGSIGGDGWDVAVDGV